MGYEEDTQARAARRRKRKRRQRTMGFLILFLMILVIAGVVCFVILGNGGDNLELVKNGLGTAGETASGWIQSVRDSLPDGIKEKLPAGWFET